LQNNKAKVLVAVSDGITIGHPCCAVHNCKEDLTSRRDKFCPSHQGLNNICSITHCSSPIMPGSRVCSDPSHIEIERRHVERGQARFQLQQRLQQACAIIPDVDLQASTSDAIDVGEEEFDLDLNGKIVAEDSGPSQCPSKPATGNRRVRAQFGRKRTHNEQIIVAPCGVIIARATFYGAEAVSSVAVRKSSKYLYQV
jgi:hypothetical protein